MEEIILIILLLLTLLTTFCLYKMLNKRGLYFSLIIMNLLALVLSFKITYAFRININISIIPIIASMTILYIFIFKYGIKENKNLLLLSLYSNIITSMLMVTMNYFLPAITETISINMQGTFEYNYKIWIIYPLIILLSQFITIKLFNLIKEISKNNKFNIILTYIISGIIYTIVYYLLSYINIMKIRYSLFLGVSTYIFGIFITIITTFFVDYIVKKKVIE